MPKSYDIEVLSLAYFRPSDWTLVPWEPSVDVFRTCGIGLPYTTRYIDLEVALVGCKRDGSLMRILLMIRLEYDTLCHTLRHSLDTLKYHPVGRNRNEDEEKDSSSFHGFLKALSRRSFNAWTVERPTALLEYQYMIWTDIVLIDDEERLAQYSMDPFLLGSTKNQEYLEGTLFRDFQTLTEHLSLVLNRGLLREDLTMGR